MTWPLPGVAALTGLPWATLCVYWRCVPGNLAAHGVKGMNWHGPVHRCHGQLHLEAACMSQATPSCCMSWQDIDQWHQHHPLYQHATACHTCSWRPWHHAPCCTATCIPPSQTSSKVQGPLGLDSSTACSGRILLQSSECSPPGPGIPAVPAEAGGGRVLCPKR